jgi:hypothetical protein
MTFEGTLKDDEGSGTYRFVPNAFFMQMTKEENKGVTESEQPAYFVTDISKLSMKMPKKQRYAETKKSDTVLTGKRPRKKTVFQQDEPGTDPKTPDPVSEPGKLEIAGISDGYMESLELPGLELATYNDIIKLKMVGVTPEYIKALERDGKAAISILT